MSLSPKSLDQLQASILRAEAMMGPAWMRNWLAPSVVLMMMSVVFGVGVFVGNARDRIDIARIDSIISNHLATGTHEGAVSRTEMAASLVRIRERDDEMIRRLERIEAKLSGGVVFPE